ncbi:UNVERIFIED_CONTAM: hypothetical protein K2H54_032487 [Gekko kuhli]
MNKVWTKIQKKGTLHQSTACTESISGPALPSSPVKSSVGTAPPDTSTWLALANAGIKLYDLMVACALCRALLEGKWLVTGASRRVRLVGWLGRPSQRVEPAEHSQGSSRVASEGWPDEERVRPVMLEEKTAE